MEIPDKWIATTFGKLAEFRNGLNFNKSSTGEAIKIVSIPHFWNREISSDHQNIDTTCINGELSELDLLQNNDLLFVRSNGNKELIGRCLLFKNVTERISFSGFTIRARLNQTKIYPDFAATLSRSELTRAQFMKLGGGTNISNLSQAILNSVKIALPPLPEQKRIAEILSTWDRAIEVVEGLIENSQVQKKALMQQLLTAQKRLPGFDGEWNATVLSKVAQIIMGSSPKSTAYNDKKVGLPLLQGNADIKNRLSAPRIHTSQVTKECLVDDILLSVRAPVGEVSRSVHDACIGRGISAIRTKDNAVQEFVYQWLLLFEPKWARFSQGSTFEAVNSSDIRTLKLCIPSKDEQKKIATILSDADHETELLAQQLTQLKSEKSALMQQLLTGKRRVKIDKEAAA